MGVGFALNHDAVSPIGDTAHDHTVWATYPNGTNYSYTQEGWLGHVPTDEYLGYWIDSGLLIMLGGIPWQVGSFYMFVVY